MPRKDLFDVTVRLPKEAGEKAFSLEEELALPNGVRPEKLLYYSRFLKGTYIHLSG